ncbi:hypothetical protein [Sphingomonas sp. S-NIH.Pt1_0416]|uniref:hypothetical protein n=1 Tax=Sphingomonas sp. S-NIH.Pt1_0416 TaxID=1920123 RepID=UPI0013DEC296|nr:hypothetical protein [Sphingomonas sp. S-NIH.Pt1_0416]
MSLAINGMELIAIQGSGCLVKRFDGTMINGQAQVYGSKQACASIINRYCSTFR